MAWWTGPWGRARQEARLEAELRDHIERHVADRVRNGLSESAARREARLALGGVERTKDACRDVRPTRWIDGTLQDVRYALRQLRRQAAFSTVALFTLVMGIAATTTILALVDGVLLRPLPYDDPDRLVRIQLGSYSPAAEFLELRGRAKTLRIAAYRDWREVTLTGLHEPARLPAATASAALFDVLGSRPALGRTFREEETRPGASRVVVLSHGLWQQRFGGDPRILGRSLVLDGIPRSIVGVMPAGFRFPSARTAMWMPLTVDPASSGHLWGMSAPMIGRLRPGVTPEQARTELRAFTDLFRALYPTRTLSPSFGRAVTVVSLHELLVGDVRRTLLVLLAAIGSVMLIVCVNVANLLLTRGMARHRELAIRGALGAGRGRLFRQLLVESLTLALIAGALGTTLAFVSLRTVVSLLPADLPRIDEIRMDARVIAGAVALSLVAGVLCGLLPALRASLSNVGVVLSRAGRAIVAGRTERRVSDLLAGVEVALALVLVIGAALLVKSFWNLSRVDPGFRIERLVSATVVPSERAYADAPARRRFAEQLVARVREIPGVQAAAFASSVPFGGEMSSGAFAIEGRPDPATQTGVWMQLDTIADIGPDYLQVLGVPLLAGRSFGADDHEGGPKVVLISRSLARSHWGAESPLGARIKLPAPGQPWLTIVGVVDDVKWSSLAEKGSAVLYRPVAQSDFDSLSLVVRMTGDSGAFAANLRGIVSSMDDEVPVSDIRTADDLVGASMAQPRFTALVLTAFAVVALALGAIGIYGVMAYAVSQRTREIGVRVALGASRGDLLRQFLGRGLRVTLAGIAAGLAGALVTTRALASLLFGVEPLDVMVFAGVAVVLTVVGLAASYLPARRAARLNPIAALQAD